MGIRHILVPLTGAHDETHVVVGAMRLAKRLNAHVAVTNTVAYRVVNYDLSGAGIVPAYYEEISNAVERVRVQARAEARRAFDAALAQERLPMVNRPTCGQASTWYDRAAERDAVMSTMGKLTDLIVVKRPNGTGAIAQLEVIEDALFSLRRPVLLLPYHISDVGEALAVAWNGALEAANALKASLSLVRPGAAVTLIQVGAPAPGGASLAEAADYLGWHGYTAQIREVADKPHATAQIIMSEARAAGAQLLVMGGYSHSRVRELLFGGVTAAVLKQCDMPVLMVH